VWLEGTAADCALTTSPCATIRWPGNTGVYMKPRPIDEVTTAVATWMGSLLANGVGSTGMAYRRNRFYDATTGQFNQQDPIGLAGGANSYGFVAGDPVNYSDPFGLCPPCYPGMPGMAPLPKGNPVKGLAVLAGVTVGVAAAVASPALGAAIARWLLPAAGTGAAVASGGAGLTGRLVDALENAGPQMGARINAVLGQVPASSRLDVLMTTDAESGAVTIQGGTGDRLRQVIMNTDGSSVVKAFDAAKDTWKVVKEIKH
jgi:RHS repeat-associated protein